jgi:hypothetical protein
MRNKFDFTREKIVKFANVDKAVDSCPTSVQKCVERTAGVSAVLTETESTA